jgi:hypothetical protein
MVGVVFHHRDDHLYLPDGRVDSIIKNWRLNGGFDETPIFVKRQHRFQSMIDPLTIIHIHLLWCETGCNCPGTSEDIPQVRSGHQMVPHKDNAFWLDEKSIQSSLLCLKGGGHSPPNDAREKDSFY